jgi:multidrug efflux pump subunit AcrB
MALAVGILVDDATVEIENIHRNLHQRKRLVQAILDGAQQIAVPAFVSTLCICIVFVPVWFITGAAKSLFIPLAMAVVFAMLTSYLLSRTLVPTMVHFLLESEIELYGGIEQEGLAHDHPDHNKHVSFFKSLAWGLVALMVLAVVVGGLLALGRLVFGAVVDSIVPDSILEMPKLLRTQPGWAALDFVRWVAIGVLVLAILYYGFQNNWIWRTHQSFNNVFEKFRRGYGGYLKLALAHRAITLVLFVGFVVLSFGLIPFIGRDFFPSVDAGQLRLHVRGPAGTRLEQSELNFAGVEKFIRTQIPADEISVILDNIGIPNSGINMSLSDGSQISPADGEILISLNENHHPTAGYMKKLRAELPRQFPDLSFWFQPADIATQVLNFGIPAPIDVQIKGTHMTSDEDLKLAEDLRRKISGVPGAVDVHLHQVYNTPDLRIEADRTIADQMGVRQQDVAQSLLVSLSSSGQTQPNFWLDPKRGVQYQVSAMTPQYRIDSLEALKNQPVVAPGMDTPQLLGNLATIRRGTSPTNITHDNIAPTFDIQANVQDSNLGTVSAGIQKIIAGETNLPEGTTVKIRGQVESMNSSFKALGIGIIGAVILVYLLMVVNFQSWLDPLIILMALPGAIAGILWMLFASRTTISVPSLMGSIMCIGVATANSILMITFANDHRKENNSSSYEAAFAAGVTRLRPVIMTALAMILGMLPMSLGMGEGGEQNAPLGRAVIGGLALATFATLFFVPVVYSALRTKPPHRAVEPELQE